MIRVWGNSGGLNPPKRRNGTPRDHETSPENHALVASRPVGPDRDTETTPDRGTAATLSHREEVRIAVAGMTLWCNTGS